MASKNYVIVKNHVREIGEPSKFFSGKESKEGKEKRKTSLTKKRKYENVEEQSCENSLIVNHNTNEFSEIDLKELKDVYKKCKKVLLKIESKYGHLLELDNNECNSWKRKNVSSKDEECKCTLKKKVVFNDDGNTTQYVGCKLDHHICPNKLQTYKKHYSLQVETENINIPLPDTIKDLEAMLKNPSLSPGVKNKIIEKIKYIRNQNLNMIRFDKESIIQKLKTNPDEVLDFKGTNFPNILGYPSKPLDVRAMN